RMHRGSGPSATGSFTPTTARTIRWYGPSSGTTWDHSGARPNGKRGGLDPGHCGAGRRAMASPYGAVRTPQTFAGLSRSGPCGPKDPAQAFPEAIGDQLRTQGPFQETLRRSEGPGETD